MQNKRRLGAFIVDMSSVTAGIGISIVALKYFFKNSFNYTGFKEQSIKKFGWSAFATGVVGTIYGLWLDKQTDTELSKPENTNVILKGKVISEIT